MTKLLFCRDCVLKKKIPQLREKKIALFTDQTVASLYPLHFPHAKVFTIPPGEGSKTRQMKEWLEDQLFLHGFGRDTLILAMGGGVVMDLAGFVASTFCRGVPLILIPTTLLGMVDASIGGKTGVNTPHGKNLIGTFYPAEEVWIDELFLSTLPRKQWINGLVEMVKLHLVTPFKSMGEMNLVMIKEYAEKKKAIIDQDLHEKGLRRILNFGHTFGHAIEAAENYSIEHGEAVAVGILAACFISEQMGFLKSLDPIFALFEKQQIPLNMKRAYSLEELLPLMARDKKAANDSIRMVLIEEVGKVCTFNGDYCTPVETDLLKEAIAWINKHFTSLPVAYRG